MIYDRSDVVILPFPFITTGGVQQKARPALVISDRFINRRYDDVILLGITSQRIDNIIQTEYLIKEGTVEFIQSGLAKTSVIRCEYVMTVPIEIIARKLGKLPKETMNKIDLILKLSLGLQ
jgi:mRNA-degrading endonuclease toxin of MazEF toxin-antitoxin module